ncbi:MAG: hypothetical protein ACFFDN_09265 [Candidatus Hodarchaeota archaeon]
MTPCQAIKTFCLTKCVTTPTEVRQCRNKKCPLYAYRLGHNPRRKGAGRPGGNPKLNIKKH